MEKKLQITLTAARVNAGFSLDEVAEKMQKSKSTIINWEKGRTSMKISEFDDLCNLYRISKDYIILPSTPTKSRIERRKYEKYKNAEATQKRRKN